MPLQKYLIALGKLTAIDEPARHVESQQLSWHTFPSDSV